MVGVGKGKAVLKGPNLGEDMIEGKIADILHNRNISAPSMLKLYCNLVELHRLRNEIILAASECTVLQQVYLRQCELAG
jgi:hypothetical protein